MIAPLVLLIRDIQKVKVLRFYGVPNLMPVPVYL
jgi:hypothetical protein